MKLLRLITYTATTLIVLGFAAALYQSQLDIQKRLKSQQVQINFCKSNIDELYQKINQYPSIYTNEAFD